MLDDISLLEILAGTGVIVAIYIVHRLSEIIEYLKSALLQQQANNAAKTETKRLVEDYLAAAQNFAHVMERLEAVADYRRLTSEMLREECKDFPEEIEDFVWNLYDERNHAICMAENRHKKHHLEEMASSILRGDPIAKEPLESLLEISALSNSELNDYFPLPKSYNIDEWEPPTATDM